jgi:hypothetical protein
MNATTHYQNANFLRELAENLPSIRPQGHSQEQAELLQRLADEELAQAHHEEWVRAKVAAARADNRPAVSTDDVLARLVARHDRLSSASR